MPYIETISTKTITPEKEASLKEKLGEAIALIKGKSESWLMLSFRGGEHMAFAGDSMRDTAMVSVELFGSASDSEYGALTARLTEIISSELGISPDRIYVKYTEIAHWGWSGENF